MALSEQEKTRIAEAVKNAERRTAGEIVPLVVRASDAYPHADLVGGVAAAILAFIAGLWLLPEFAPTGVSLVLVGGFAAGFLATRAVPALRRALIGGKVIETEVRQRALQAFIENGLTKTRDRTGILIMVSLFERRVELLADEGINAKVEPGTWDEVVRLILDVIRRGSLADGLVAGIERCGDILAAHVPIRAGDTNELSNTVREVITDPLTFSARRRGLPDRWNAAHGNFNVGSFASFVSRAGSEYL